MTMQKNVLGRRLATALLLAVPLFLHAQPAPGGPGRPPMPPGTAGDMPPPPPYLRGVRLDEAQRDKVFAILHAQVPRMRELETTRRKAQQELMTLATSGHYSDDKAAKAADALARATAEISLLMARSDSRIVALLTPEQRKQIAQRKPDEDGRPPAPQSCAPD